MMNTIHGGGFAPRTHVAPFGRFCVLLAAAASVSLPAFGQKLFYENFDTVPFGPNPEEASKGERVWTRTPPTGWTVDDTGMPGYGTPEYAANDGRTEWAGWAFADVRWWPTVDNQRRAEFLNATGGAAIADPDEWDDATHLKGLFNAYMTTPEISVAGKAANSLALAFDSSWRPEAFDDTGASFTVAEDGSAINNQTAVITAQWDGGAPIEVVRWDSDSQDKAEGDYFKADGEFINEAAIAALNNPAGAQKLTLKFGLINAANDWWWAIDNVAVGEPPFVTGASATGVGFSVRISEALGKTVNDNSPITAKLDGQTVTVTDSRDGERVLVAHDQSPTIFVPGSSHTVEVTFTTGAGASVTDSATFIAPRYTTVAATPTVVTASIAETDYLAVDETKGVQVELDGTAVTGSTVTRVDLVAADGNELPDRIDVRYTVPAPLASGSSHTLKLTYTTKTAQQIVEEVSFKSPVYSTVPTALATATGTGAGAGIRWKTHQLAAARPGGNNLAATEQQLAGAYGASIHDPSVQPASGYFEVPYVNFDRNGVDSGNFNASSQVEGQAVGDELIPGIPGLEGGTDNIAAEGLAYIEIPAAGVYSMVVNSDDGFGVYVGNATNPTFLELGKFDATRGQADTLFYFKVDQAGVYLFRLVYFQGGSDGRVEWFTVNANGTRALVNGSQTGALKSFLRRTVAEPSLPTTTPTLAVARQGGNLVLTYTGTLQSADNPAGPYTAVAGASSPLSVTPSGSQKYYRAGQ
ncbi:MAG: hypothetical protein AB7O66_23945 [Limisphaerales bacterium]